MRFKINAKNFIDGLQKAMLFTTKGISALENVKMAVNNKKLKLIACNVVSSIEVNLDLDDEIKESGEVMVETRTLLKLIKDCKDDIEFEKDDTSLLVKAGTNVYELFIYDLKLAPSIGEEIPQEEQAITVNFEANDLLNALEKTVFLANDSDYNLFSTGIYLKSEKNMLNFIATDKQRISIVKIPVNGGENGANIDKIIPKKMAKFLEKLIENQKVTAKFYSNLCIFEFGNITVKSKYIDDKFPDFETILEQTENYKKEIEITDDFFNIVDKGKIFCEGPSIMLKMSGSFLTIKAESGSIGKFTQNILIDSNLEEDEEEEVYFNPAFLLDGKRFGVKKIVFSKNDLPFVFKNGNANELYLAMPAIR
jgi:DNA polymerase III sliding clamp (beta) subunit (PCNA family)